MYIKVLSRLSCMFFFTQQLVIISHNRPRPLATVSATSPFQAPAPPVPRPRLTYSRLFILVLACPRLHALVPILGLLYGVTSSHTRYIHCLKPRCPYWTNLHTLGHCLDSEILPDHSAVLPKGYEFLTAILSFCWSACG